MKPSAFSLPSLPGEDARTRLYAFDMEGGSSLQLEAFTASELLSELYQYDLLLLSGDPALSLAGMVGRQARLMTRLSDGSEIPRSGYVSHAERLGADGALTRYRLRLVPWLWLTTQRSDCRVFQDKSVLEIVDSVLAAYQPFARWRWAEGVESFMADAPRRAYCVQYRETDYAFLSRLLAEEGLGFCFVEEAEAELGQTSCHQLLIFSHNDSLPQDHCAAHALGGQGIRFHRAGSQEDQDAVTALGAERILQATISSALTWHDGAKRSVSAQIGGQPGSAGKSLSAWADRLEEYEPTGSAFDADVLHDAVSTQRYLRLARETREARNKQFLGEGSVRSFRPGHRFLLTGSPLDREAGLRGEARDADAANASRHLLLYAVYHLGINNLPLRDEARPGLSSTSGPESALVAQRDALLLAQLSALGVAQAESLLSTARMRGYANRFRAGRVHIPWRPCLEDDTGARLNPRPTAPGLQSAIVVGPDGETTPGAAGEIHTDARHRLRVRFHWQRERSPASDITAPHTVWLRMASRYAGAGLGAQFIPRVGQEVLVGFLEGDIDRPIVLGSLYNGQGEGGVPSTPGGNATGSAQATSSPFARAQDHLPAAQGNLANGHSPAWHGEASAAGPHRHPAALSGLKSCEYNTPHAQAYTQLVFDDTDGQQRIQLATTQSSSQLNLGHLIHQADNYRGSHRGDGFELRTDAYGALRAARGAMLTTWPIQAALDQTRSEPAGDATAPLALLKQLTQLSAHASQIAGTHQTVRLAAHAGSAGAGQSELNRDLAPHAAMLKSANGMTSADTQSSTSGADVPHSTDSLLTLAGRGGLGLVAGQHQHWAAGETITWASGQDSNFALASHLRIHTGQALGVLASAKGGDASEGHLKAIAATGPVIAQAQADAMTLAAKAPLKMVSVSGKLKAAAAKKIHLAVAGGSAITLEGGNITVQCPGTLTVHASGKSFVGGAKVEAALPQMPNSSICVECLMKAMQSGSPLAALT